MSPQKRKPKSRSHSRSLLVLVLLVLIVAVIASWGSSQNERTQEFQVRGHWTLNQLDSALKSDLGYHPIIPFSFWAKNIGYPQAKACRLLIKPHSHWWNLLQELRANRGQTHNWVLHSGWHLAKISQSLSQCIDADSAKIASVLSDELGLEPWNVNSHTWPALFIPNTYNLSASTHAYGLIERMKRESDVWWTTERLEKASAQGITPVEAVIIASIVTKESNQADEYESIAGVYLNRLRRGMKLQADPTVNFARGKIARVRADDLSIESPYNTYLHEGLPPGPICTADPRVIDAVLNYKKHDFLFFCAKIDGSHRHHFSKTFEEHKRYARAFNRAMNERERSR